MMSVNWNYAAVFSLRKEAFFLQKKKPFFFLTVKQETSTVFVRVPLIPRVGI